MIRFEKLCRINFNWDKKTILTIWDGWEGRNVQMEAERAVLVYGDRIVVTVRGRNVDLSNGKAYKTGSTLYDVFMTNREWESGTKLKIYDGENSCVMAAIEMPAALMLKKVIAFYGCEVELADEEEE